MLDSSSTTKQSGAEEGASGGEGTSDTADADFGSGKAAVLAIAIDEPTNQDAGMRPVLLVGQRY